MFPNVDPRQLKQMMKQMGMSQEDIQASRVIIECDDKNIIIENPSIQKVNMKGNVNFQISGDIEEENKQIEIDIKEEDINMVCEKTSCSKEKAKKVLEETKGDIAQAIIDLQNE